MAVGTIFPKTSSGKPYISTWPTEGERVTLITHNWSDKTTWYQKSTRVVTGSASPIVSGSSYQLPHQYVIDTYHGKIWDEDDLEDSDGNSYRVSVTVDDVEQDEVDPHTGTGDYVVNYASGTFEFPVPIGTGSIVRATYHYAGSSEFVVKPVAGKLLRIRTAEVQFSANIEMTDTVDFVVYGYVEVFAPQYLQSNGGPYPPGTLIPINTTRYKTMYDFQSESNGAMPMIDPIGGSGWRGIKNKIVVFPWAYAALLSLSSTNGMEIRLRLQHDTPFLGEFGTATLYCLSENE